MSEVEASGRTVEEAVGAALGRLGAAEAEAEVEVLAAGSATEAARVRVKLKTSESSEESEGAAAADGELLEEAREDALDFLEGLLDAMELDGEVVVEMNLEEGSLQASIEGEDLGILIGRRGQTLDGVQELLRSAVGRQAQARIRVNLDIEGYRARRREAVEKLAREMAERAIEEGEVELDPMPPYERKVVHDTVATFEGVTSFSEGEDPRRRVIIRSKE